MSDLPFGLESKNTFANLSPADLQSLGKRASVAYLSGATSLNDAIIKLAREYPSISSHQVQRVVEFANQETFAKLFADNEKYASDKNVEFDVADPGYILLELNNGARSQVMTVVPEEFGAEPVKLGHSSVEADMELMRAFGVDPALPGAESVLIVKVANDGSKVVEHVLTTLTKEAGATALDRILGMGTEKTADMMGGGLMPQGPQAQQAPAQPTPQPQGQSPMDSGTSHNEQMLALQREIELAKKREELQKVQQHTLDAMNPNGQPGAVPAPGPDMAGQGGAGMASASPDAGAAMAPQDMGQAPQEQAPQAPQEPQYPPAAAGAITAPPGAEGVKMGSLIKQAMDYVKSGRPKGALVEGALKTASSLEAIKTATAQRGQYPMANPFGDLIRTKQKVAKLLEDAAYAKDKNDSLLKEAADRLSHLVAQHLWDGGSFGEVSALLGGLSTPDMMKTALAVLIPDLIHQGLDPVRAQADLVNYEMTKGASSRAPNLDHPIAHAYAAFVKLAQGAPVLHEAYRQLRDQASLLDKELGKAGRHVASL